jgi:manganese transport protein
MREFVNPPWLVVLSWTIAIIICLLNVYLIISTIFRV